MFGPLTDEDLVSNSKYLAQTCLDSESLHRLKLYSRSYGQ